MSKLEDKYLAEEGLQKKKEEENVKYVSYFETKDIILEQINKATLATHTTHKARTDNCSFIMYSKLTGEWEEIDEFEYEDCTYKPISNKMTQKGAVALPTGVEEYGETSDLIKEIKEFLFYYFEPPKFYEKFLPFYVLLTWVYEKFPFLFYIHFVGLSGTGKTVAAETLTSICYKAIDAGGTTISSMFRLADQWRGTLFIDEFEPSSFGSDYSALLAFLKTGVSDRIFLRTEGDGPNKRDVDAFEVKSPKIFTSENPVNNVGFVTRSYQIKMEKKTRPIPLYKLDDYPVKIQHLRNKLLLWRFRNLNDIDFKNVEFGDPALEGLDGRVQQILTPIYLLSDDETRKILITFAKEQQQETYRERQESLEGQILVYISEHPDNPSLPEIVASVNQGEALKRQISEKKAANIVRKILRFDIVRMGHDNISRVIVEEKRLNELRAYYGVSVAEESHVEQVSQLASADDYDLTIFTGDKHE